MKIKEELNGKESVRIFDLAVKGKQLPTTMEKLIPLSFIGTAAVQYYRAKIKLMRQLEMAEEQRKLTVKDAQQAAEMLLRIKVKIGKLLPTPKEAMRNGAGNHGNRSGTTMQVPDKRPIGIDRNKAINLRALASKEAEKIVEAVISETKDNETMATESAVLKKLFYSRKVKAEKTHSNNTEINNVLANITKSLLGINSLLRDLMPYWNQLDREGIHKLKFASIGFINLLKETGEKDHERKETRNDLREIPSDASIL